MKSPFPGMDPYIEACGPWESFHDRLIAKIDETIARRLPRGYITDIGARSYLVLVESEGKKQNLAKPDVSISETATKRQPRKPDGGPAVAILDTESVPMQAFIAEEFKETFVEIYDIREERTLVTSIEVLSPSNKRPKTKGWKLYMRKRQAMLLGQANFIEIDLLRSGKKMPMITPWPDCPYTLLVSRHDHAPNCRVWPAHYRRPLPPIPVPLLRPDPDLTLDLQPLIDGIYSLGRYDEQIDYAKTLTPPLPDADAAWLREQLKEHLPRTGRKRSSRA